MPKKKKAPTAEFLKKYGIPTALVPGIIIAAAMGFNWEKIIEKDPRNNHTSQLFNLSSLIITHPVKSSIYSFNLHTQLIYPLRPHSRVQPVIRVEPVVFGNW